MFEAKMNQKIFKIQAPQSKALDPKELYSLLTSPAEKAAIDKAQEKYLSWEEFRYKTWVPGDKETICSVIRFLRYMQNQKTPIMDCNNTPILGMIPNIMCNFFIRLIWN